MATKLTLSISEKTIKRAKLISRQKGKSISKMVEEYLDSINVNEARKESAIEKIQQIMEGKITNPEVDWKKAKAQQLKKKYGV